MISTGVQWRKLEAEGIERLQGAGVYYGGGSTEALSCAGEIVYVVGGANSAGQATGRHDLGDRGGQRAGELRALGDIAQSSAGGEPLADCRK